MLSDNAAALLENANLGHLATVGPDGAPQVTPVWVDIRDGVIYVNSAVGRVKTRNVERDGRVALSVADQDDPYTMVAIRGRVLEVTKEGADEHIDFLAKKYLGKDTYPWRNPQEQRVIIKIEPRNVAGMG